MQTKITPARMRATSEAASRTKTRQRQQRRQVEPRQPRQPRVPNAVDAAIAAVGSQTKLAALLGVKQQAISIWRTRGWVPVQRAREIELHTGVDRVLLVKPMLRDLVGAGDALGADA